MSELTPLERGANFAISRHYDGDGRWGRPGSGIYWSGGYMIRKYRPRLTRWERSRGRNAKKVHALRYRVTASTGFRTPVLRQLNVWWCGTHSYAKTDQVASPIEVCRACLDRLTEQPKTVRL